MRSQSIIFVGTGNLNRNSDKQAMYDLKKIDGKMKQ